jgi:exopolysaccharide production protein ExoQ
MRLRTDSLIEKVALYSVLIIGTGAGLGAYLARQEVGAAYTYNGGNRLIQLMFSSLYLYFFFQIARSYREVLGVVKQEKWLAAFWLWALLSAAWSAATALTIVHWVALLGTGMVGLYIGVRFEPREQLNLVAGCLAVCAVASFVAALALPAVGLAPDGAWQGIFFPKNSLGRMMALGTFCFVLLAIDERRKRWMYIAVAVFCGALLLLSQSATAIVVCVIMLGLLPFRKLLSFGNRLLVPLVALLGMVAVPFVAWLALNSNTILGMLGRDSKLTGRLPLWDSTLQEIVSRPLFGFGYGAFWTTTEADGIRSRIGWSAPNAHNGFLEILLGLGLMGGAFFLIGLLRNLGLAVRAARGADQNGESWPLFFLIFNLLYSFTESSLLSANSILSMLFVANSYWVVRANLRPEESSEEESESSEDSSDESFGYASVET